MRGRPVPTQATRPPIDRAAGGGLDLSDRIAALTAVSATLTQQLAVNAGVLSANTAALVNAARGQPGRSPARPARPPRPAAPGGGLADKIGGLLTGGLMGLATKLVAPLAPLAILAQTLNTTTSGFGTFLKMTQLVTTSLAGLFLPAMLVVTGATFAVAQAMQGPMLGALEELAGTRIPLLMGVIDEAAESLETLNTVANKLGIEFGDLTTSIGALGFVLDKLGVTAKDLGDAWDATKNTRQLGLLGIPGDIYRGVTGEGLLDRLGGHSTLDDLLFDLGLPVERYQPPPGGPDTPKEGFLAPPGDRAAPLGQSSRESGRRGDTPRGDPVAGFMGNVVRGMEMALKSMRQDIGPPAQFGQDLTNIWRSATLAGLNEDPIAKEQRDLMLKQLDVMERMLGEIQTNRQGQYE